MGAVRPRVKPSASRMRCASAAARPSVLRVSAARWRRGFSARDLQPSVEALRSHHAGPARRCRREQRLTCRQALARPPRSDPRLPVVRPVLANVTRCSGRSLAPRERAARSRFRPARARARRSVVAGLGERTGGTDDAAERVDVGRGRMVELVDDALPSATRRSTRARLAARCRDLDAIVAQANNAENAGRLWLSPRTVGSTLENGLLLKLGVAHATAAAALARRDDCVASQDR